MTQYAEIVFSATGFCMVEQRLLLPGKSGKLSFRPTNLKTLITLMSQQNNDWLGQKHIDIVTMKVWKPIF